MLTRVKDGAACSGCPGPGAQGGSLLATRLPLAHPDPPFGLKAQPPLGPVPKERPEHLRQSGAHSSQCVPVPNSPCLLPVSAVKNRVLGAPWGPLIPAPLRTRPAPAGTQTRSRGVGGVPPSTPSLNLTRRSQGQLSTELTRFVYPPRAGGQRLWDPQAPGQEPASGAGKPGKAAKQMGEAGLTLEVECPLGSPGQQQQHIMMMLITVSKTCGHCVGARSCPERVTRLSSGNSYSHPVRWGP